MRNAPRRATAYTLGSHACHLLIVFTLLTVLGPADYGLVAFVLTIQAYLSAVGSLGLRTVVVRELITHPDNAQPVISLYWTATTAAWLLSTVGCLGLAFLTSLSEGQVWLIALIALGSFLTFAAPQPLLDATSRLATGALVALIVDVAIACIVVWLGEVNRFNYTIIGCLFAAKWLVVGGVSYWLVREVWWPIRVRFDPSVTTRMLRSAWPLFGAILLGMLPGILTSCIVEGFGSHRIYATYAIGCQAASAYLVLAAVGSRFFQSQLGKPDELKWSQIKEPLLDHLWLNLLLLTGSIVSGLFLTEYLLDPFYAAAQGPLILLLVGAFLTGLGVTGTTFLVAAHDEKSALAGQAVGIAVAALGCVVIVPRLGALGAGITSCGSAGASLFVIIIRVRLILIKRSTFMKFGP